MKLYVDIKKENKERITTFLKKCYNINSSHIVFTETYFDELCQNKQCKKANRSFEDLYATIKTYYHHCSKKHFAKQLDKLIQKSKLKLLFCPDISKWVLMNISYGTHDNTYKNLYNYDNSKSKLKKKGKGKYNYYDIMLLMGYSKEECEI